MSFRTEAVQMYNHFVKCDCCQKEELVVTSMNFIEYPLQIEKAQEKGYSHGSYESKGYKNYCKDCKEKMEQEKNA